MSSVLYGYMLYGKWITKALKSNNSSLIGITSRYSTDHGGLVDTDHYKAEAAPSLALTCSWCPDWRGTGTAPWRSSRTAAGSSPPPASLTTPPPALAVASPPPLAALATEQQNVLKYYLIRKQIKKMIEYILYKKPLFHVSSTFDKSEFIWVSLSVSLSISWLSFTSAGLFLLNLFSINFWLSSKALHSSNSCIYFQWFRYCRSGQFSVHVCWLNITLMMKLLLQRILQTDDIHKNINDIRYQYLFI